MKRISLRSTMDRTKSWSNIDAAAGYRRTSPLWPCFTTWTPQSGRPTSPSLWGRALCMPQVRWRRRSLMIRAVYGVSAKILWGSEWWFLDKVL